MQLQLQKSDLTEKIFDKIYSKPDPVTTLNRSPNFHQSNNYDNSPARKKVLESLARRDSSVGERAYFTFTKEGHISNSNSCSSEERSQNVRLPRSSTCTMKRIVNRSGASSADSGNNSSSSSKNDEQELAMVKMQVQNLRRSRSFHEKSKNDQKFVHSSVKPIIPEKLEIFNANRRNSDASSTDEFKLFDEAHAKIDEMFQGLKDQKITHNDYAQQITIAPNNNKTSFSSSSSEGRKSSLSGLSKSKSNFTEADKQRFLENRRKKFSDSKNNWENWSKLQEEVGKTSKTQQKPSIITPKPFKIENQKPIYRKSSLQTQIRPKLKFEQFYSEKVLAEKHRQKVKTENNASSNRQCQSANNSPQHAYKSDTFVKIDLKNRVAKIQNTSTSKATTSTKQKKSTKHNINNQQTKIKCIQTSENSLKIKISQDPKKSRKFGFDLALGPGRVVFVKNLDPLELAAKSGLKNNDQIITLNGCPSDLFSFRELEAELKTAAFIGRLVLNVCRGEEKFEEINRKFSQESGQKNLPKTSQENRYSPNQVKDHLAEKFFKMKNESETNSRRSSTMTPVSWKEGFSQLIGDPSRVQATLL